MPTHVNLKLTAPKSLSYASALHPRPMRELFDPITPYSQGFLSVGGSHTLYWEQSGNPDGVPILVVHGGPGAGGSGVHRRFLTPVFTVSSFLTNAERGVHNPLAV